MGCSNLMLHGVSHDCTTNVAGISKIYFTYRDSITPVVNYNTNTVTSFETTDRWYEYDFAKNSASLSSTLGFTDNGIPFYTHTINMSLNGLSAAKNLEVMALADNELVALVVDANGKAWYVGVDGYINSSSSEFATGADVNNRYGYALTIDGSSEYLPFEYLGTLPDDPTPTDNRPYLTFHVTGAGNIKNGMIGFGPAAEYRINYGEWVNELEQIPVVAGDIIQFRASGVNPFSAFISSTAEFYLTGYLSSIINGFGDFENLNEYTESSAFNSLFANCTGLTDASNLILIKEIGVGGYSRMFYGCTNLKKAPEILGTTAPANCYSWMFRNCSSLTTGPSSIGTSATTMAASACTSMFQGCTSLTTAPELPATTLGNWCYQSMFDDCTNMVTSPSKIGNSNTVMPDRACYQMFSDCSSLTTAPELPAKSVGHSCCHAMFRNCTSLTTAPELPATTVAPYCYQYMFQGCTNLVNVPSVLPATTLAEWCYANMFNSCTNLVQAPALPATTVARECYRNMFRSCRNLTQAPSILPATTLVNYCYNGMFSDCTSLTTAPILPATTLIEGCYSMMFYNCSSLNYIKCLASDLPVPPGTSAWVNGVQTTSGTFVTPSSTNWTTGVNGIPSGWTRVDA